MAQANGVPLAAVNSDDYVAQVRQQRAQQQAAMTAMQAAKPLASAVKDVASVQQAA
jgi:lipid II:glycine glycyltransferase (peptidoglycan interpeptide bridge formation enzyme)